MHKRHGAERNGKEEMEWNGTEWNRSEHTHGEIHLWTEQNAREGGREGKFFSIITCTNGTERNVMESQKRTERSDREGEIEKEMKWKSFTQYMHKRHGAERNGKEEMEWNWNRMEQIRTHTRRDSPLNGTDREGGREGGRDGGKVLKNHCVHKRNGAERNKMDWNGTEWNRSEHTHGEIHRRAGSGLQSSGSGRARA